MGPADWRFHESDSLAAKVAQTIEPIPALARPIRTLQIHFWIDRDWAPEATRMSPIRASRPISDVHKCLAKLNWPKSRRFGKLQSINSGPGELPGANSTEIQ